MNLLVVVCTATICEAHSVLLGKKRMIVIVPFFSKDSGEIHIKIWNLWTYFRETNTLECFNPSSIYSYTIGHILEKGILLFGLFGQ